MCRVLASLLCVFALNVRADWTGWHPSAWTNYRSNVETVGVFATSHSYVLTNYVGTNQYVVTNAFLSNIYAASNGTSIVSTFSFTLRQTNGVSWTSSITSTNWHTATNLVLAPREIVCFDLYRAMRERDAALCVASSAKDSVRFYRHERDNLTYAKTWLAANIANFISTNQPVQGFAPLTATNLLSTYGFPSNYLAQTPYRALWCGDVGGRMVETSRWVLVVSTNITTNLLTTTCGTVFTNIGASITNVSGGVTGVVTAVCTNTIPYEGVDSNGSAWGFCGITNLFNALLWTVAPGEVSDACGGRTNLWHSQDLNACDIPGLESNFVANLAPTTTDRFPLFEYRKYTPQTNVTYQLEEVIYNAYVDAPFVPQDCPTNFPPPSPWLVLNTNRGWMADSCELPTNYWSEAGQTNLLEANYHTYAITNTITNVCDAAYECPFPTLDIAAHIGPISFANCTNRYGTNVQYEAVEWYNSGSTNYTFVSSPAPGDYDIDPNAVFTDPFGLGLSSNGWTNVFSYSSTNLTSDSICRTNFATPRVPWEGSTSTNPMAWVIYDARLVKKWQFQYRP